MIRYPVPTLLVPLVVSAALSASASTQTPAAQPPAAQPKPAAAPTCTYNSRTYGDGAFVCVEKSLMLKCTVDDARASWSVVADKDLGDKCRAPTPRGTIYQQRALESPEHRPGNHAAQLTRGFRFRRQTILQADIPQRRNRAITAGFFW